MEHQTRIPLEFRKRCKRFAWAYVPGRGASVRLIGGPQGSEKRGGRDEWSWLCVQRWFAAVAAITVSTVTVGGVAAPASADTAGPVSAAQCGAAVERFDSHFEGGHEPPLEVRRQGGQRLTGRVPAPRRSGLRAARAVQPRALSAGSSRRIQMAWRTAVRTSRAARAAPSAPRTATTDQASTSTARTTTGARACRDTARRSQGAWNACLTRARARAKGKGPVNGHGP